MIWLLLAALLWTGVHVGVSGTGLRGRLVASVGEGRFTLGFSIASVVTIILLAQAWNAAPILPLWSAPGWLRWVLALLMLPAFVLFIAAVTGPNPTTLGGKLAAAGPAGIQRVTRHPMLCSFSIWGGVHLIANGTLAGVVFFGAFLVTALLGMPSIDTKIRARDPETWARLAPSTSILPFGAILSGRNRLVLSEIGPIPLLGGLAAWLAMLWLHPLIFGWPALPS
jgi:uncharacterized membrane protein